MKRTLQEPKQAKLCREKTAQINVFRKVTPSFGDKFLFFGSSVGGPLWASAQRSSHLAQATLNGGISWYQRSAKPLRIGWSWKYETDIALDTSSTMRVVRGRIKLVPQEHRAESATGARFVPTMQNTDV